MTPRTAAALASAGIVGAALFAVRQAANAQAAASADSDTGDGSTALDYVNPFALIERTAEQYQTAAAMQDTNTAAFLSLIEFSEGTSAGGRDPYRTCYAYAHTIASFADHPAVTGEWRGERLPDEMCRRAGFGAGCVSTAAGRHQLIKGTWLRAKRALALPDFSPASQDAAAVWLISQRGAIDDVRAGRIADAIAKCRAEWASLPGAGYGQPERRITALLDAYTSAGGVLA